MRRPKPTYTGAPLPRGTERVTIDGYEWACQVMGGYVAVDAFHGYDGTRNTPERARLIPSEYDYMKAPIAEGSGEAMLAVARLYGYEQRDVTRSVQKYDDAHAWNGMRLLRVTYVPQEVMLLYRPGWDEGDYSDAARIQYDDDGYATLRCLR